MKIRLDGITVGCELWLDGVQRYLVVAETEAWRANGERTRLLIWESRCAQCGSPFFLATTTKGETSFNRRCADHHQPGRPAFKRRRKV